MYFHTDSGSARTFIENVARLANEQDQRLRIDVDDEGNLRMKRGEGMWSAPISSTPDPYRDAPRHCGHDACAQHKRCIYV